MKKLWKKGRGKLGSLDPLLGQWTAEAESPMGPVKCVRHFERVLGDSYLRLDAEWRIGGTGTKGDQPKIYRELAVIGIGDDKKVWFWSFTSDGKRSQGHLTDVSDIHPEAVGFEAQMPAGLARQAYWPDDDGNGFHWAVEARSKKGWKRFTSHHYTRA